MKRVRKIRTIIALLTLLPLLIIQPVHSADQGRQDRPIPLGISGGNILDMSNAFCCSGTLGALVHDNNQVQYILSNNHVLARTNKGTAGEAIIQPGLVDETPGCHQNLNDAIAELSKFVPISFRRNAVNQVDAAISKVQSGQVDPSGSVLNIGELSNMTVSASWVCRLKKPVAQPV